MRQTKPFNIRSRRTPGSRAAGIACSVFKAATALARRWWLKVDANTQWFRMARGFKDLKWHPDLMQR
jgi:hypothetical protein